MITDLGIWTIVISGVVLALAVQYSRSETFGQALRWLLWDFTGMRFITSKVIPFEKTSTSIPVTLTLWVFGIYTALFAITSHRYEMAAARIENRMNAFITQLAVAEPDVRNTAFREIAEIQRMQCPREPHFPKPSTVFLSLIRSDPYDETITVLTRTVEKYIGNLEGAFLLQANLKRADLRGAHLEGAVLEQAHLEGAALSRGHLEGALLARTDFRSANLSEADFEGALMWKARLDGASLRGARLKGANLHSVYLEGAVMKDAQLEGAVLTAAHLEGAKSLTIDQLCSTKTLFQAKMDQNLETQVKKQCPELLEYVEIERGKRMIGN